MDDSESFESHLGVFLAHEPGSPPSQSGIPFRRTSRWEPGDLRVTAIMASARGAASSNGPDFIPRPRFAEPLAFRAAPSASSPTSSSEYPWAGTVTDPPAVPQAPGHMADSFLGSDPFLDTPGASRRTTGLFAEQAPSSRPAAESHPQPRAQPRPTPRHRVQVVAGRSVPARASSAMLVRPDVWGDVNPERGNRPTRRTREQLQEEDDNDDEEEARIAEERRRHHIQQFMVRGESERGNRPTRRTREQLQEEDDNDDEEEARIAEERRRHYKQQFMLRRSPSTLTDSSILTVHEPRWTGLPTNSRVGTLLGFSPRSTPARSERGQSVATTRAWNHPTKPCDWDEQEDSDAESGFGATTTIPARSFIPTPGSEANFRARPQAPTNTATEDHDDFVCAISESRSGDVIGVAIINITTGQTDLVRILNDNKYQRLVDTLFKIPHPPQCFLVLNSVSGKGSKSLLVPCLEVEFASVPLVSVPRAHWNEAQGLAMVDSLARPDQVKALRASLDNNFYVSCAFSAAMTYIREQLNLSFSHHSMRITYNQPSDSMALDRVTVTSLELLENIRPTKFKGSTLFGILNSTRTPQGRRLLRSSLLQPSTDEKQIIERYEAVEELVANEELFLELGKRLRGLLQIDIERVALWIDFTTRQPRVSLEDQLVLAEGHHHLPLPSHQELQSAEQELNNILMLRQYLVGIEAIRDALASAECTSRLCSWVRTECSDDSIGLINALIDDHVEKDTVYSKAPIDVRNNRLWAIKSPPNGVLEQARKLFKDHTVDLNTYIDSLNQQFSEVLGSEAGLHLDSNRHYYLKFQWSDVEREIAKSQAATRSGDSGFRQLTIAGVAIVNGVRKKNTYQCQTMELIQRSRQIQFQADIVTMQSDRIVVELKKSLAQHAGALLEVGEAIATLDMLCCFVQLSTTQNYVRPVISNTLVLQQARHPIMDVRKANFIPNDAYSGDDGHRFQVITGSNMSGKSTFIKSVALIQILAQMGCFVPATFASVSICDRLFTRLSTEDKPESNLGTFAVEMREMNLILRQATKNSMVIIDELGRGTSPKDGLAVALAMSEKLIDVGSRVFFATHFTKLARILNISRANSVLNIHLSAESHTNGERRQITLPHTVSKGPVKNEDYGLDLASRFFPPRIIRNAEKISHFLRGVEADKKLGPETQTYKQNRLVMALPDILQQANDSSMDDATLVSYLNRLCIEFTTRMDQIDQEDDIDLDADEGTNVPDRPVLEKPDAAELETLMQRFQAEEQRVMKNNAPQQPPSENSAPTMSETASTVGEKSIVSEPTLPVPINRAELIREQEAAAALETVSSVSFSVDGDDIKDEDMWTSSPSGF